MRIEHWLYVVPLRLRSLFRPQRVEQELDEEHQRERTDRLGGMGNVNVWYLVFVAGVALLFFKHRQVREAIETFKNNFPRGGPRTPMHPSPAGDDALLRRKSSKKVES